MSEPILTPEQRQELRYSVRAYMGERFPAAMTARQIRHAVRRELDFAITEADVTAALEFMAGLIPPQTVRNESTLGAMDAWQATSRGVQAWERNEA